MGERGAAAGIGGGGGGRLWKMERSGIMQLWALEEGGCTTMTLAFSLRVSRQAGRQAGRRPTFLPAPPLAGAEQRHEVRGRLGPGSLLHPAPALQIKDRAKGGGHNQQGCDHHCSRGGEGWGGTAHRWGASRRVGGLRGAAGVGVAGRHREQHAVLSPTVAAGRQAGGTSHTGTGRNCAAATGTAPAAVAAAAAAAVAARQQ